MVIMRTSLKCLMLMVTWFVITVQTEAQDSHRDIGGSNVDLRDLIDHFNRQVQRNEATRQEAIGRAIQEILKDPRNAGKVASIVQEFKKQFELSHLERELRAGGGSQIKLTDAQRQAIRKAVAPFSESIRPQLDAVDPSDVRLPALTGKLDDADLESRARLTRWLAEQAKRMEGLDAVQKSPVLKRAREDLETFARNQPMPDLSRFNIDQQMSRLGVRNLPEKLLNNLELSWPRNLNLPKLPRPTLPRVNLPWSRPPALPLPGLGTPPAPSGSDTFGFLSLAIGGMLLLLAWKLYRTYRPLLAQTVAQHLAARRWPVDASALTTRADVIRAFEHLSLSQLGLEARSRHHRDIATGLGGQEAERRREAEALAAIYEQARYTPGSEPLPADTLEAARRALTHLVGTAPA